MLCYGNGAFLQALEGQRSEVNRLYNRITQDARHRECEVLVSGSIEMRRFADWSMKLTTNPALARPRFAQETAAAE